MKILVVIPNYGMGPATLREREEMLRGMTSGQTEVKVVAIERGPETIESAYDEVWAGPAIIERVEREAEGYDAVIVYCTSDPAVPALRELLDIPVIGPGKACLHLATILGYRFSVLSVLPGTAMAWEERIKALGFERWLASVRSLDIPVADLREDLEHTAQAIIREGRKAIEEDDAHVLILGCLGLAGLASQAQEVLGIPVIDPAAAALKMAETMIDLGVSQSRLSYPKPPKKVRV